MDKLSADGALMCFEGLGGTSLLNANVFLRADRRTMALKEWPPEIKQTGSLDKCEPQRRHSFQAWLINI